MVFTWIVQLVGGGHAEFMMSSLSPEATLIGFDQDPTAIAHLKEKFSQEIENGRLILINDAFSNIERHIKKLGFAGNISGIYADIGVSSPQLDQNHRGFSFKQDGPLNMRMDQDPSKLTAAKFVNTADYELLVKVFNEYGEEPKARFVADAILKRRQTSPISSTKELADLVKNSIFYSKKSKKHPATKVFQAIRIYINQELDELEKLLSNSINLLKKNGRLSIISFHSLEDRLIKQRFKALAGRQKPSYVPKEFAILTPEPENDVLVKIIKPFPIIPSESEISENPRARSAKLRVCEKI